MSTLDRLAGMRAMLQVTARLLGRIQHMPGETTARTEVSKEYRSTGIGAALLLKCLLSMREMGYGYAIIGGVEEADGFYRRVCGATPIPASFPGVYENVVGIEKVVAAKRRRE